MIRFILLSGSLKFWYPLGRGCLYDQPPVKILGNESLMTFSGRQHSVYVVAIHCWKNCVHCGFTLKRTFGSLHLVSCRFWPHTPQSFADFALYPSTVMHLRCEHKYMPSHVSPSRELLNLGVVLILILDTDSFSVKH